jgi:tetratricopeptide (TPR) repeat protein
MPITSLAVLAISLTLTVPQAQDARAEAERLAKAGDRAEALRRFQAIVTNDPGDIASRLWIGRLHLEMGHPHRAVAVYESIIATNPQHVDALLGLGLALTADGRMREASDALNRAEALAADRVDVLAAQGALHAAEGRSSLSLAYYDRALALDTTNMTLKDAADVVRARRAHRIDVGYDLQHFNTSRDDSHTGSLEVNLHLTDTLRVFGLAQTHRNFLDDYETRGGGGVEWMPRGKVWLRAGFAAGSGTLELPALDAFGSVVAERRRATWTFDLRYVDFDGADLIIGGAKLALAFTPRLSGYADYHRGQTRFDVGEGITSDNVTLGVMSRLGRRASGFVEYTRGIDRLDWLTLDRIGATDANTISGGASFDATPFVTLRGRFDHQSRPDDISIQRASAQLSFRF